MGTGIEKILIPSPVLLNAKQPLTSAIDDLVNERVLGAPVLEDNKVVGILLTVDALYYLKKADREDQLVVADLMLRNYPLIYKNSSIDDAILWGLPLYPVVDSKGDYTGIITTNAVYRKFFRVMTQRFHKRELILQSISNGVLAIDTEEKIIFCNNAAGEMLAVNPKEIIGKKVRQVFTDSLLYRVLQTGETEYSQRITINGGPLISNRCPLTVEGKVVGAVVVFQHINQMESIFSQLENVKHLYNELDALIESSHDGILVVDSKGKILRINKSLLRLTGLKERHFCKKIIDQLYKEDVFRYESVTMKALQEKRSVTGVQKINNGKEVLVTGTPVFDGEGNVFKVVTNVRDVSELNSLREELRAGEKLSVSQTGSSLESTIEHIRNKYMVAESDAMRKVLDLALKVAQADTTVLLLGESGVGKEVIARLIHDYGIRAKEGDFIRINCGAIPENLLESELFGYEPGAFTGASKEGKIGLFESANNGTLLLDEIAELPLNMQVKLLRVLQEHEFYRIGGVEPIRLNVRIIAATNKDLESLIKENKFRTDLYYRLNVVPIKISPLRFRKEDIFPLVIHFLKKHNQKHKTKKSLDAKALSMLENYSWPGNVRELENLLERLVILSPGEYIEYTLINEQFNRYAEEPLSPINVNEIVPLREANKLLEQELILKALVRHKTVRSAARALGISHSSVIRKMALYDLRKTMVQK